MFRVLAADKNTKGEVFDAPGGRDLAKKQFQVQATRVFRDRCAGPGHAVPSTASRRSPSVTRRRRSTVVFGPICGRPLRAMPSSSIPPSAARTCCRSSSVLPRVRAGIDPRDLLLALQDGRIVAGSNTGAGIVLAPGAPGGIVLGGTRYRGVVTSTLSTADNVQFAALAPQRELAAAITSARWRIAVYLLPGRPDVRRPRLLARPLDRAHARPARRGGRRDRARSLPRAGARAGARRVRAGRRCIQPHGRAARAAAGRARGGAPPHPRSDAWVRQGAHGDLTTSNCSCA